MTKLSHHRRLNEMTRLAGGDDRRLNEMTNLSHQQFSTLVLPTPLPSPLPSRLSSPLPSPLPPPLLHRHVQHPRQLRPEHRRPRRLHANLTVPHSVRDRRIDLLLHLLLRAQSLRLLLLGLLGHSLRSQSGRVSSQSGRVRSQSGAIRSHPVQSGAMKMQSGAMTR